ncbi:MAG: hypothetical protein LBI43_05175 [Streptococcaceae bacterium]|jgi:ABC-2 type transport system permease protein|nr:hypothetical protein [Streptococcaceae bacterium]
MKILSYEFKKFILSKRNLIILGLIFLAIAFVNLPSLPGLSGSSTVLKSSLLATAKSNFSQTPSTQPESKLYAGQIKAIEENNPNQYWHYAYVLDEEIIKNASNPNETISADEVSDTKAELRYIALVKQRHLTFEWQQGNQTHAFGDFVEGSLQAMGFSIFTLLFAILVSTPLSSFFESGENRFSNFIHISSRQTLLSKVLVGVVVTFFWLLIISIINILVLGLINGFGSFNYPASLWNNGMSPTPSNMAIPVGLVCVLSLLYFILILLFLASLGALLSALTKRSLVVIGIIAILVVGWSLIETQPMVQAIRPYVPMSYLNPVELLSYPTYLFKNASFGIGAGYLASLSLLCLVLANGFMKNYRLRRI